MSKFLDPKCIYAVDNKKNRSFITGLTHSFGGFIVRFLMVDGGCNSHLLPIEDKQIDELFVHFPPKDYIYTIETPGGVALIPALVLEIEHALKERIPWYISQDFNPVELDSEYLRFSLCDADIRFLLDKVNAGTFALAGAHKLQTYVDIVADLQAKYPTAPLSKRRKLGLFGRDGTSKAGKGLISWAGLTIISNHLASVKRTPADMTDIKKDCLVWEHANVTESLTGVEFDDLEDEFRNEPSAPTEHYDEVV